MTQTELIKILEESYPSIRFLPGASYHWSPSDRVVYFLENEDSESSLWALLHETSHGLLKHTTYKSDFELLLLEVAAWDHTKKLADELNVPTNELYDDHKEDCLDSYRDWQHKRSLCPQCNLGGIQTDVKQYQCLFCNKNWSVSAARFCRPYRLMKNHDRIHHRAG